MRIIVATIAAAMLFPGCKKAQKDTPASTGSSSPTMGSSSGSASAGPTAGSGSSATAPAAPLAQADVAKRVHDCLGFQNAGKWDELRACYADDASYEAVGSGMPGVSGSAAIVDRAKVHRAAFPDGKIEPQLLLVNGKKAITVVLLTGKNTGPMKGPSGEKPATNKSVGLYVGQVFTFDDKGKVAHEDAYFDLATIQGQLSPGKEHPVRAPIEKLANAGQDVLAKDDATEKANLATFKQMTDAFNKHDATAFGAVLADDVVWSEQATPKDMTKKELIAGLPAMWKGFSDLKLTPTGAWAAGDYVAAVESYEGTNDGDVPKMHLKKSGKKVNVPFLAIHEIKGGKVKSTWIFYQQVAFATQLGLAPAANDKQGSATPKPGDSKK